MWYNNSIKATAKGCALYLSLGVIMKRIFFTFFVYLSFALPAAGEDITFEAGSDYQITVPGDWVEIPREAIDQYQKVISENTGQHVTFEYGYQSTENENWFVYPYALVQIKRNGRVPEDQLTKYKKIESGFDEGIKNMEEAAGELLSNISQGETIYDPAIHTLWSNISMDVEGIGRARALIAIRLTEYGFIQFMGYALEQDFSQYESLYRRMVHSINIEEKDIYKSRITDNTPTIFGINLGRVAISAIIGALIGGLFGLFKMFKRKNS